MCRACHNRAGTLLRKSAAVSFLAASVSFAACVSGDMDAPEGAVYVRLELAMKDGVTRSSLGLDEDRVSDINIYAYSGGRLCAEIYSDDPDAGLGVELTAGYDYDIYALANTGKVEAPEDESELLRMRWKADLSDGFSGGRMPMAARADAVVAGMDNVVCLELVRLMSKVNFRVEPGELGGLEVTSVRVLQSPVDIAPFSGASEATEVGNGDCASAQDLDGINGGGEVCFYMLENCQGVLLPDNTDQWEKVPDNIPDKAGLCTYLEVRAEFNGSGGLSGPVVYRFFLGQDNTSDFNVIRNTESTVVLYLTEDGLGEVSWRIDSSGVIADGIEYVLDAPSYCGQWGTIDFPEATADSPVTVTWRGNQIRIPSETPAYIGSVDDDAPTLLVYVPEDRNTLHLCFGTGLDAYTMFTVSSGIREQEVALDLGPYLRWALYADYVSHSLIPENGVVPVNEDGYDIECWFYLYDAEERRIVEPGEFDMPESVRRYLADFRSCPDCRSHIYWYYSIDAYVEDTDIADIDIDWGYRPAEETAGESYLYTGSLYALAVAEETPVRTELACGQNYLQGTSRFNIEIEPAFPGQKHFGYVYNYQLALGDMQSAVTRLNLDPDVSSMAEWVIAKGKRYEEGDASLADEAVMDFSDRSLISVDRASDYIDVAYGEPERFDDLEDLAGGTYHIRGTVTNPHTGRKICGDYSIDVILYLVMGVDVHFYRGSDYGLPSGTYMDFSYVPVTERYGQADEDAYHGFWSMFPVCDIYNPETDMVYAPGAPFLSGRSAESMRLPDLDDLDSSYSQILSQLRSYLSDAGQNFYFVDPSDGGYKTTVLYTETQTSGSFFYEVHRLYDIVPGVYFIEDYYGSFDNH